MLFFSRSRCGGNNFLSSTTAALLLLEKTDRELSGSCPFARVIAGLMSISLFSSSLSLSLSWADFGISLRDSDPRRSTMDTMGRMRERCVLSHELVYSAVDA